MSSLFAVVLSHYIPHGAEVSEYLVHPPVAVRQFNLEWVTPQFLDEDSPAASYGGSKPRKAEPGKAENKQATGPHTLRNSEGIIALAPCAYNL